MFRSFLALLLAASTLPAADDLAAQMKSVLQAYSIARAERRRPHLLRTGLLSGRHPRPAAHARPAFRLLRPRPVRAAQEDGDLDAEGLRQRRLAPARPRHHAADPARHAIGEIGTHAGRRDPRRQRLHHRPARHRPDHRAPLAIAPAAGAARRPPRRFAQHPALHSDARGDAVAQRRPRLLPRRRHRVHPRLQLRREDRRRARSRPSRSSAATGSPASFSISATTPAGWSPRRSKLPRCFCRPARRS